MESGLIKYLQNCEIENKINIEEARLKFETIMAGIAAAPPEQKPPSSPPSSKLGGCFPPISAGDLTGLFKGIADLKHLKIDVSKDGKNIRAESEIITAKGAFTITANYLANEQVNNAPEQPQT